MLADGIALSDRGGQAGWGVLFGVAAMKGISPAIPHATTSETSSEPCGSGVIVNEALLLFG